MQRRAILILGKVGSGKSTLARRLIAPYDRVIVFDPLSEYHEGLVVESFEQFANYFADAPESFFVVCRFQGENQEDVERMQEYALRATVKVGRLLLVLEECEMYFDSYNRSSYANYLVAQGRHHEISLLAIGRRPTEIPIKLRSQFTTVVSFRQTEPKDLAYLASWDFSEEELQALPPFKAVCVGEPLEEIEEARKVDVPFHEDSEVSPEEPPLVSE
jgi:hypothetical protein